MMINGIRIVFSNMMPMDYVFHGSSYFTSWD